MSGKFLEGFKKHQNYFYVSLIFIVLFFVGSALITPKITGLAENLLKEVIEKNRSAKKNIITFEFNRLNSFLMYSEQLIEGSAEVSFDKLKERLLYTSELARTTNLISNSFIYSISSDHAEQIHLSDERDGFEISGLNTFSKKVKSLNDEALLDTIINRSNRVINRKVFAKKINSDTTIVVGYDIDLLGFWQYFSETSSARGGYSIVTNEKGICILHPDTAFIGEKLNDVFKNIPIEDIINHEYKVHNSSLEISNNILKDRATSQYLGLEVLRYFDKINIGNSHLIFIESFPVDINLKEATEDIRSYFSWISLLAFLTFMALLLVSRLQQKREYSESLEILAEKDRLMIANETYQKQNAVLQLDQLKKKMNPHFLFNSLNALHVLIESKPDLSQEFVHRLAEVYRYLLENKEGNLTSVKKEIDFLKQYIFLQEVRFKDSLNVSIENADDEAVLLKKIPFLALQTVVENAIKHNQFTKINPLNIQIIIEDDVIIVLNNYTPRKINDKNSHQIGLSYLRNIYLHHEVSCFGTEVVNGQFKCVLPLLS